MGAEIGEYIHLHYKNYLRYGLARNLRERPERTTLQTYFNNIKQDIKQAHFFQNTKDLENQLNTIFSSARTQDFPEAEGIQTFAIKYIESLVNEIDINDINWETLTIKPGAVDRVLSKIDLSKVAALLPGKMKALAISTLKNSRRGKGDVQRLNLKPLETQIQNIKAAVQLLEEGSTSREKIEKNLKKIDECFKNCVKNYKNSIPRDEIPILTDFVKKSKKGIKNNEFMNLPEAVNYIGRLVFTQHSIQLIEGSLAEAVVAGVYGQMIQISNDTINDLMGDLNKTSNVIFKQNISSKVDVSKILPSNWSYNDESGEWRTSTGVLKKADVLGSLNDPSMSGLSVKSYNMTSKGKYSQNISLVSGTSLFYLFQNYGKFFNHYLNQTVASREGVDNLGPSASVIKAANEMMRRALVLLGFTGVKDKHGALAKIFVVNDKSSGKKKVIDIGAEAQKLTSTASLLSNFTVEGIDHNTAWANDFVPSAVRQEGAYKRITNLLALTHQRKISVSLKKGVITKL